MGTSGQIPLQTLVNTQILRIVRDPATRLKGRLRETTGQNHSMDRKKGLWGINHQGYFLGWGWEAERNKTAERQADSDRQQWSL